MPNLQYYDKEISMKTWSLVLCLGVVFILFISPLIIQESAWYQKQIYFFNMESFETAFIQERPPPARPPEDYFFDIKAFIV